MIADVQKITRKIPIFARTRLILRLVQGQDATHPNGCCNSDLLASHEAMLHLSIIENLNGDVDDVGMHSKETKIFHLLVHHGFRFRNSLSTYEC